MNIVQDQLESIEHKIVHHFDKSLVRMQNQQNEYRTAVGQIALAEEMLDQLKTGVFRVATQEELEKRLVEQEKYLSDLLEHKTRIVLTMKSNIWNASNTIRSLHKRAEKARADEE